MLLWSRKKSSCNLLHCTGTKQRGDWWETWAPSPVPPCSRLHACAFFCRNWLAPCAPATWSRWWGSLPVAVPIWNSKLCSPPFFQNSFIVLDYIYIYVCASVLLVFGNGQLLLTKIAVRTLSDYFRFQPGHLSHSSICQTVSGFQVIRSLSRVAWGIIDGDLPMWF